MSKGKGDKLKVDVDNKKSILGKVYESVSDVLKKPSEVYNLNDPMPTGFNGGRRRSSGDVPLPVDAIGKNTPSNGEVSSPNSNEDVPSPPDREEPHTSKSNILVSPSSEDDEKNREIADLNSFIDESRNLPTPQLNSNSTEASVRPISPLNLDGNVVEVKKALPPLPKGPRPKISDIRKPQSQPLQGKQEIEKLK